MAGASDITEAVSAACHVAVPVRAQTPVKHAVSWPQLNQAETETHLRNRLASPIDRAPVEAYYPVYVRLYLRCTYESPVCLSSPLE